MDREEIQAESRQPNQRMDPTLIQASRPEFDELIHGSRSIDSRHGSETHANCPVRITLDDVAIFLLVSPRVTNSAARHPMKLPNSLIRDLHPVVTLVNELERVTVASDFFFVAISEVGLAQHDRPNPSLIHDDALDPV